MSYFEEKTLSKQSKNKTNKREWLDSFLLPLFLVFVCPGSRILKSKNSINHAASSVCAFYIYIYIIHIYIHKKQTNLLDMCSIHVYLYTYVNLCTLLLKRSKQKRRSKRVSSFFFVFLFWGFWYIKSTTNCPFFLLSVYNLVLSSIVFLSKLIIWGGKTLIFPFIKAAKRLPIQGFLLLFW